LAGLSAFFLTVLIIADGRELIFNPDVDGLEGVRWFWDLTCDFWAVF
jgi:hypothetical protein